MGSVFSQYIDYCGVWKMFQERGKKMENVALVLAIVGLVLSLTGCLKGNLIMQTSGQCLGVVALVLALAVIF